MDKVKARAYYIDVAIRLLRCMDERKLQLALTFIRGLI